MYLRTLTSLSITLFQNLVLSILNHVFSHKNEELKRQGKNSNHTISIIDKCLFSPQVAEIVRNKILTIIEEVISINY